MLQKIFGLAVIAGLLALLAYLYQTDRASFASLWQVSWIDLALLTLTAFGFIASQGFILRAACKPFGIVLDHLEAFGLLVVTFFVNYVIPFLGFGVRGAYLNRRHNMTLADFGSSLIATLAIELAVYAAAGLVALFLFWRGGIAVDPAVALVMLGAIGAGLVVGFAPVGWLPFKHGALGRIIGRLSEAQALLRQPATLVPMVVWTFVQFASFAACFWIAFRAIAAPISASAAAVTAALTDFSLLIRLTPAAAGTFEGAVYYAVQPFSVTLAQAILAALLVRLALAAIFLPLGGIAFFYQVRNLGLTASSRQSGSAG